MAAVIYISKEQIKAEQGTMPIIPGLLDEIGVVPGDIRIEGVTNVTAGYNLIYVEYQDKDSTETRIRAFGRTEFKSLLVWGDDTAVLLPLDGLHFTRQTYRFDPFNVEDEI